MAAAAERHRERDVCGGDSGATVRRQRWWVRRQTSSDSHTFKRHRHANVRAFVLGQGRRDDGADSIIIGNSGARGEVHRGRRDADEDKGNADDTIC